MTQPHWNDLPQNVEMNVKHPFKLGLFAGLGLAVASLVVVLVAFLLTLVLVATHSGGGSTPSTPTGLICTDGSTPSTDGICSDGSVAVPG